MRIMDANMAARWPRQLLIVSAVAMTLVLGGTGTALAAVQTVTLNDPIGDVPNGPSTSRLDNEKGPGYFDIVQAIVTGDDVTGTFTMSMRLAASVPLTPANPKGNPGYYFWVFGLDTQPGSNIKGYPLAPGNERPFEYFVFLTWDGSIFDSYMVDRTPLLSGGEATITDIPFSFNADRAEITFEFDGALIGSPTTFSWLASSAIREADFGTKGFQPFDIAGPTNWP